MKDLLCQKPQLILSQYIVWLFLESGSILIDLTYLDTEAKRQGQDDAII